MADFALTNRMYVKGEGGRFLARYEAAKRQAIARTVHEGAAVARVLAPKRSGRTAASIHATVGTSGGSWSVNSPAGMYQELGTAPHPIHGMVSFFWEREGRPWVPGMNWIHHPGNPALHFMERSYRIVAPKLLDRLSEAM